MSAFDSMPEASVSAKSASGSFGFLPGAALASFRARVQRVLKTLHPTRVGFALDAVQEPLFIQEEIAGEHALTVKLLEEIAGRDGDLAERFLRDAAIPKSLKFFAGLLEIPARRAE